MSKEQFSAILGYLLGWLCICFIFIPAVSLSIGTIGLMKSCRGLRIKFNKKDLISLILCILGMTIVGLSDY